MHALLGGELVAEGYLDGEEGKDYEEADLDDEVEGIVEDS